MNRMMKGLPLHSNPASNVAPPNHPLHPSSVPPPLTPGVGGTPVSGATIVNVGPTSPSGSSLGATSPHGSAGSSIGHTSPEQVTRPFLLFCLVFYSESIKQTWANTRKISKAQIYSNANYHKSFFHPMSERSIRMNCHHTAPRMARRTHPIVSWVPAQFHHPAYQCRRCRFQTNWAPSTPWRQRRIIPA